MNRGSRLASHGQAVAIARLFGSLLAGGLLFILFRRVITPILDQADTRTEANTLANDGTRWLGDILGAMPFVLAAIAMFGLIAIAVFQARLT